MLLCKNTAFYRYIAVKKTCLFTETYFCKKVHFYATESCFLQLNNGKKSAF